MTLPEPPTSPSSSILIVDSDIIARHAIADYLRRCGYAVVEAANADEAMIALKEASLSIDIILCDEAAIGTETALGLEKWARQNRTDLEIVLAGSVEVAVKTAAELCQTRAHLPRPYEPEVVLDYIKRLRAARADA